MNSTSKIEQPAVVTISYERAVNTENGGPN